MTKSLTQSLLLEILKEYLKRQDSYIMLTIALTDYNIVCKIGESECSP